MKADRVNAFTDGVLAIVITIMVLELPVPEGTSFAALRPDLPLFGAYILSFINIGIYWNNHHHMMHSARRVDGRVLWANLGLLFWLSLIPFVIRWIESMYWQRAKPRCSPRSRRLLRRCRARRRSIHLWP